jgi:hypothetical protein
MQPSSLHALCEQPARSCSEPTKFLRARKPSSSRILTASVSRTARLQPPPCPFASAGASPQSQFTPPRSVNPQGRSILAATSPLQPPARSPSEPDRYSAGSTPSTRPARTRLLLDACSRARAQRQHARAWPPRSGPARAPTPLRPSSVPDPAQGPSLLCFFSRKMPISCKYHILQYIAHMEMHVISKLLRKMCRLIICHPYACLPCLS